VELIPCSTHLLQLVVFYRRGGQEEEDHVLIFSERVTANSIGRLGQEPASEVKISGTWDNVVFGNFWRMNC
jgi:hypothetical protein